MILDTNSYIDNLKNTIHEIINNMKSIDEIEIINQKYHLKQDIIIKFRNKGYIDRSTIASIESKLFYTIIYHTYNLELRRIAFRFINVSNIYIYIYIYINIYILIFITYKQ